MEDYEVRMKQEYRELKERIEKLHHLLVEKEAGTLDFELSCPVSLLEDQLYHMNEYLKILETIAEIEKINLNA